MSDQLYAFGPSNAAEEWLVGYLGGKDVLQAERRWVVDAGSDSQTPGLRISDSVRDWEFQKVRCKFRCPPHLWKTHLVGAALGTFEPRIVIVFLHISYLNF